MRKWSTMAQGNGSEPVYLDEERVGNGGDFDPADPTDPNTLYIDNGDGIFDPATDTPYDPANPPVLTAYDGDDTAGTDQIVVFVVSDIPAGQDSGDVGTAALTATAGAQYDANGGAPGDGTPGDIIEDVGDDGSDVVIGANGGEDVDTEDYVVSNLETTFVKSADKIFDALSGTTVAQVVDDGTG